MGIRLRGTWLVLAWVMLGVGVLAGCSDEPPEPSTIKRDHTASNTPTATPTPTSTLSTEEQQAVEAAEAAYHRRYDVVTRLSRSPSDYTGSEIRKELYKVGGDPQAYETMEILRGSQILGRVQRASAGSSR